MDVDQFDIIVQKCLCSRAAPEDSKKWGMLNLVNQLFKIYFKVKLLSANFPTWVMTSLVSEYNPLIIICTVTFDSVVNTRTSHYDSAEFALPACKSADQRPK